MDAWLKAALGYIPSWLEHQLRATEQPGCVVAVAHRGRVVFEQAFGSAGGPRPRSLTPRHRFRVASHSKSFTAAGIMKLREAGRLRLDDPAGQYVDGLHPAVAEATLTQLLSHSAGLIRDGSDAGQWQDRRPFASERDLLSALAAPPVLEASTRLKYSNHGFGLIGLIIEAVTGESYGDWIRREIIDASKLRETDPDWPPPRGAKVAHGHGTKLPLGRRVSVPGDNPTRALAPATGFVSTAADLARFFATLDPEAKRSVLSPASRREMIRRQWHDPHAPVPRQYGLGIILGKTADWQWFGHSGGFQSCLSRTSVLPGRELTVSVVANAIDGMAGPWSDGIIRILRSFATHGAPTARTRDWTGRWWSLWSCIDLVAQRDRVLVTAPAAIDPFAAAPQLTVGPRDTATISAASAFSSHGESARLVRGSDGGVREIWLGGTKLVSEARARAELKRRYDA
ncbi:MAG: beta-lactamase family protein [bacterium]|nr:beta-lactamase family protein [bacterium]